MSESSVRGRAFELKVQKLTSKILHLEVKRDSRSGAGLHKQDVRDRYNLLPLFVECKDQESLSVKKEWRIADQKSSYGQAPVVVFPDDSEILCVMRYGDLLQFIKEAADWKEEADDLRTPDVVTYFDPAKPGDDSSVMLVNGRDGLKRIDLSKQDNYIKKALNEGLKKIIARGGKTCRNEHIADEYGYCMQLDCKYSRGYRAPKVKKK